MDFNATIDLIIKDLNDAREIIDDLKKIPGVPALQVELAKSKCKSAAEVIALIKTMDDVSSPMIKEAKVLSEPQSVSEPKPKPQAKPVPKPDLQPQPEPLVEIQPIPESQPQPQTLTEPEPQTQSEPLPEVKSRPKSKPKLHEEKKSTILADNFGHLSGSFNEQFESKQSENDIKDYLNTRQLSNLTDAIGVNDRFLYIREVFNGNKEAYMQAIERLNVSESLNDARAIIMSYTGESNENEAVKQLLDLVKHKLSANE
jgi:hypothetical protein